MTDIYRLYRKTALTEMVAWHDGFDMAKVSVGPEDAANGSPKTGDMIARQPTNHNDVWLIAAAVFADTYELASPVGIPADATEDEAAELAENDDETAAEEAELA